MIIGCCSGVFYFENLNKEAAELVPSIRCRSFISSAKAYEDWLNTKDKNKLANGDYHCYCKNIFETMGLDHLLATKLLGEEGDCKTWHDQQNKVFWVSILAPIFVALINALTEVGFQQGSEFTRPINHQSNVIDTAYGILWIQLTNLGLLFLIINLNVKIPNWKH